MKNGSLLHSMVEPTRAKSITGLVSAGGLVTSMTSHDAPVPAVTGQSGSVLTT
ncbi:hypothetical protein SAMN05216219_0845 [Mycetocola miduiensis]|uniref:Uncharacterized protein n=1 Tax=Mycetocola miduiensis TaxID=995034 RepID=A0A1I4ZIP2_9MICO|nr:hypothetical protein SAMN05216219_0845 [Mycetocola miduiensis]